MKPNDVLKTASLFFDEAALSKHHTFLYGKYKDLIIKNTRYGNKHTIMEIIVRFSLTTKNDGTIETIGLPRVTRPKALLTEVLNSYSHSHVSAMQNGAVCRGSTVLEELAQSMSHGGTIDEDSLWNLFYLYDQLFHSESQTGGPYVYMEDLLDSKSEADHIMNNSINISNSDRRRSLAFASGIQVEEASYYMNGISLTYLNRSINDLTDDEIIDLFNEIIEIYGISGWHIENMHDISSFLSDIYAGMVGYSRNTFIDKSDLETYPSIHKLCISYEEYTSGSGSCLYNNIHRFDWKPTGDHLFIRSNYYSTRSRKRTEISVSNSKFSEITGKIGSFNKGKINFGEEMDIQREIYHEGICVYPEESDSTDSFVIRTVPFTAVAILRPFFVSSVSIREEIIFNRHHRRYLHTFLTEEGFTGSQPAVPEPISYKENPFDQHPFDQLSL